MVLITGDTAPGFSLKDKDNNIINLSAIDSKYVNIVIYFYPKDNTPGCIIEANDFTKFLEDFEKINAKVIGISGGDENSKKKFCDRHNIQVTLLSDPEFKTSKLYGVYGKKSFLGKKFMGINRSTFILDKDKNIIKKYPFVKAIGHAEEVLGYIKDLNDN